MADIKKTFTQAEMMDLIQAVKLQADYMSRQQSYKDKPDSVKAIYKKEEERFRLLLSKLQLTQ